MQLHETLGLIMGFIVVLGGIVKYFHSHITRLEDKITSNKDDFHKILETYAKKNDLSEHINRIEEGIKEVNKRLNDFFNLIFQNKGGPHV